jgi:hypothetical protein
MLEESLMNLTEARKVYWLSTNHRPLGELLDEGYLDRSRLEWAAQKAFDPQVKQAALVMLAWLKEQGDRGPANEPPATPTANATTTIPTRIRLEDARNTLWPFAPFRGQPMGSLVETRQLSLKDLGYAAETAREQRVRDSAVTLIAMRLGQASSDSGPSRTFLQIHTAKRTFAERQQLFLRFIQGMILGVFSTLVLGLAVVLLIFQAQDQPGKPIGEVLVTPAGWIALAIVLFISLGIPWLCFKFVDWLTDRINDRIELYHQGQQGEDHAVDQMRIALTEDWSLYRNVEIPGRGGDTDAILVGPTGVWALEIKTFTGKYRNIGKDWSFFHKGKWIPSRFNPGKQAKRNASNLSTFLKADSIKAWVSSAIIWAEPESPLEVDNPAVAVWQLSRIADELANQLQGKRIPDEDLRKINDKLNRLMQKEKSKH